MSALRHYAQIPVQDKYLVVIANSASGLTYTGSISDISVNAVSFTPGNVPSDFTYDLSLNAFPTTPYNYPLRTGQLYKDLGRQFIVLNNDNQQLSLFRECMQMYGSGSEGVNTINIWIKTWSAVSLSNQTPPVAVARIG